MTGLLSRLQDAPVGTRELDFAIYAAMRPTNDPDEHAAMWKKDKDAYWFWMSLAHYTTSLDAALALAEQVLPGVWWIIGRGKMTAGEAEYGAQLLFGHETVLGEAESATPALALCAAIIAAKEGT